MINYTEKGFGLHEAVSAAGHFILQQDGAWISSDDTAVQAIIDGYTLSQAKAFKCAEVSLHAKALRDKIVFSVSMGELASWPIKRAEAEAFAADPNTACPILSAEASARGITLATLISKVDVNASYFAGKESAIGGNDGKHRDAINALTTFEDVAAYNFSAGWPVV